MTDRKRFIHRTLKVSASDYEKQLSRTLVGILARGIHDLSGIVAELNKTDTRLQSGEAWTDDNFAAEMQRLGTYPNSVGAPVGEHALGAVPAGTSTDVRPKSAKGG